MSIAGPLKYITVPALSKQTATVIFVHGLGDTGHGWQPIAEMFKRDPSFSHVKWILPHSPVRPVTANMGMEMPSWFDIYSFGFDGTEDEKGMLESSRLINQLISAEVELGINSNRIVLGGFSQGGAMSLLAGLTSERKLAGIAILSSWLPLQKKFKNMISQHATSTPLFWGHGSSDPLVKVDLCHRSIEILTKECGIPKAEEGRTEGLKKKIYDGVAHSSSQEELNDLKSWLKSVIPNEEGRL